jgi:hypothetical protein
VRFIKSKTTEKVRIIKNLDDRSSGKRKENDLFPVYGWHIAAKVEINRQWAIAIGKRFPTGVYDVTELCIDDDHCLLPIAVSIAIRGLPINFEHYGGVTVSSATHR